MENPVAAACGGKMSGGRGALTMVQEGRTQQAEASLTAGKTHGYSCQPNLQ